MPVLAGTVPYPWPYDGCLDTDRLALVVAGAQAGWMEASCGSSRVAACIAGLSAVLRDAGALVVLVQHARPAGTRPGPLPPERRSAGARPGVVPAAGELVVRAGGIDGFHGGPLDGELRSRGVDHLVLAGFGGEACVDSTLRSANDRGYECLTLTDVVAYLSPELGRHALASITMSGGIFGAVGSSDALVHALSQARPLTPMEVR